MQIVHVLLLSIVEGITEFLPVSSTGHLVLTSYLLNIEQTPFIKSFEIVIQLGAIFAVVFLYLPKLVNFKLWPKILAGFLPSAVFGFLFYKVVKTILIGNIHITIASLFFGGVFLLLWEKTHTKTAKFKILEELSLKECLIIGLFQTISLIPGVSRAAATIIGGLWIGADRKLAAEFSFLVAVPTMAAATGLDLFETRLQFSTQEYLFLVLGLIGSFVTALIVVKAFLRFIKTNNFVPFGIYRIILGLVFVIFLQR